MSDEINVKVSGSTIYRAVKNYLDNSPEMQKQVADAVAKNMEVAVKNRVLGMMEKLERDIVNKTRSELDIIIKREVEAKVASYIAKGVKKMFEGET